MNIRKLCLEMGVSNAADIPKHKLVLQSQMRFYCEKNHCGMYGRSYACPPHIGEINALMAHLSSFSQVVFFQNIYSLEDSFDYEGMTAAKNKHKQMTLQISRAVYKKYGKHQALVLSAGACDKCNTCALFTHEPCRHPDDALAPLEAYGINVSQVCNDSLKYINGENTVTYFSAVFVKNPFK